MFRSIVLLAVLTLVGNQVAVVDRAAAEPTPKIPASDPSNLPPILDPPRPGERAFLGVVLDPNFTEDQAKALGLTELTGAYVLRLAPRAPAENAGMQLGDVILQFRNVTVKDHAHLIQLVTGVRPGTTANMVVWRNGKKVGSKAVLRDYEQYMKKENPAFP